jgi:hypothetical protein
MDDDFEDLDPDETREWMAELVREQLLKSGAIPNLDEAEDALIEYWMEDDDVLAFFPTEYVVTTYGTLLTEIAYSVLLADNPEEALREKLSHCIFHFARYLVFIIRPEPHEDDLRNPGIGITGALGPHVLKVAQAMGTQGDRLFDTLVESKADADTELKAMHLYWFSKLATLEALASVYGMEEIVENWKPIVLRAACSLWEYAYREAISLPPALDEKFRGTLRRLNFGIKEASGGVVEGPNREMLAALLERFSDDSHVAPGAKGAEAEVKPDVLWSQISSRIDTTDLLFKDKKDLKGLADAKRILRESWAAENAVQDVYPPIYIDYYYGILLRDIVENILESPTPELSLREKLVDSIYTLARYAAVMPVTAYPDEMVYLLTEADEVAPWTAMDYDCQLASAFNALAPDWYPFVDRPTKPEDLIFAEFLFWTARVKILTELSQALGFETPTGEWTLTCLSAATNMWTSVYQAMDDSPLEDVRDVARDSEYQESALLLNLARGGARDPVKALQAALADGPSGPKH